MRMISGTEKRIYEKAILINYLHCKAFNPPLEMIAIATAAGLPFTPKTRYPALAVPTLNLYIVSACGLKLPLIMVWP